MCVCEINNKYLSVIKHAHMAHLNMAEKNEVRRRTSRTAQPVQRPALHRPYSYSAISFDTRLSLD